MSIPRRAVNAIRPEWAGAKTATNNKERPISPSKPRQHDLADGAAGFQESHRPHEVHGLDGSVVFPHGRADATGIDEIGDLVQQPVLGLDVGGLKLSRPFSAVG